MGPLIVYTDASYEDFGSARDFNIDIEAGTSAESENRMTVELPDARQLERNAAVYVDGTEWGGLVLKRISDTRSDGMQWECRTWQGVWADKVLVPDAGQAYNFSVGSAEECIQDLIDRLDLGDVFAVGDCEDVEINYRHARYPYGLEALYAMLASAGLRPTFKAKGGAEFKCLVGAVAIREHDEETSGERADMRLESLLLPYNHCIGLGQGEGAEREVVNRYADVNGVISNVQTLFGSFERTMKHDNPSAESEDLLENVIEDLADAQGEGEAAVYLPEGATVGLGDRATAYDQRINKALSGTVTGCVVRIEYGKLVCEWSIG